MSRFCRKLFPAARLSAAQAGRLDPLRKTVPLANQSFHPGQIRSAQMEGESVFRVRLLMGTPRLGTPVPLSLRRLYQREQRSLRAR